MTDRPITPQQPGIADALAGVIWRKSSFSGTQGNCVEVATSSVGVVVRDSKNPDAAVLRFAPGHWQTFIQRV